MSNGNTPQPAHLTPYQLLASETAQWKTAIEQAMIDLRCAAPAIVVGFNASFQTVTVQVAMKELVKYPNGPKWVAIHPIYNVPIVLPRAGGFAITLPIVPGDEGLLVFSDTMFDLWFINGQPGPPNGTQPGPTQPPGNNAPIQQPNHERRRHDITDCFFIPGIWNQTRVLANYQTDRLSIRNDAGTFSIDIHTTGDITINSTGNVNVNAQGTVNIISAPGHDTTIDGKDFLMHTHGGVQTGTGITGPVT